MSYYNNSSNHISESILIQYLKMGFKPVPIADDGETPNTYGLLNQEEQKLSMKESKIRKVEPLNYIYNHPEFWNEERLTKEAYRFKNVATLPGRTHLKTEDGSPLYLNALDIDSERVNIILSRLSDRKGKDFYFIDRACKSTFVSKTKKRYGRHIFWLSDKQHKPIITSECESVSEFEIKTKFGLITLPESRHRDDPNFHYQKIGMDKIERMDRMYDLLLDTLKDCLKPIHEKNTNHYSKENTNNSTINLNDEQIDTLYQSLSPCYRTGYRDQIIFGLSGLMHKHHVAIESSISLIQKLSIDDEEKDNRLLNVRSTYQKSPKEVNGYQYFLSVLENVVDGGQPHAKTILRKIIDTISIGHTDQDAITSLTEQAMTEYSFRTMRFNHKRIRRDIKSENQDIYGK